MSIDTVLSSSRYRSLLVDPEHERVLITNYLGTEQEKDLTEPANCGGFGRIRHFHRHASSGWVSNPLPIDPALRALGVSPKDELRVQLFQNAGCNWRCWYCFVPFALLAANRQHADWMTAGQMIDLMQLEASQPSVIVLSGGEPGLTPEWILWLLRELDRRQLDEKFYVWSDDNLSTDYFWQYLSAADQEFVATRQRYGRVACFKGFDSESFAYNTCAREELFDTQFQLMRRLIDTGIDLYAYVTLTSPRAGDISDRVRRFADRLQELDENLPLRTVPLEVKPFTPVGPRLTEVHRVALKTQWAALEVWRQEIANRFSGELRAMSVVDVPFASRH